jgi:hypothetical protein
MTRFDAEKVTDDQTEVDLGRTPTQRSLSGSQILHVPTLNGRYLRTSFRLMAGVVSSGCK